MVSIVHEVLDSDAEENDMLIDGVSETYFKSQRIHGAFYIYSVCSIKKYQCNLA